MRVSPIKKWCISVISVMSVVKQTHTSNTSNTNAPVGTQWEAIRDSAARLEAA